MIEEQELIGALPAWPGWVGLAIAASILLYAGYLAGKMDLWK